MPPTTLAPTGAQASQDTDALLTPAALSFLAELHTAFAHRRTPSSKSAAPDQPS